ncbi:hypothetical protein [Novosphingobium album (ex Liu et al. 2023)]|uniref:LLM class flavin-dependent oxidoreductase n=1 Tax=Novosphingobium album (ex Liu et al. 2023) TaxID=3031130 RepID=A0ABT5WQM0_9SPHN|nr:hypothetical protein [Novosphingobium album (ex Liu et al. 2023)]MDE8652306.1 hypothetical protein [Novosphingobium album (ex Liu et al. 2023)]
MRFDSALLARVGDISRFPETGDWLETAKLVEACGFTGIWSAEHHFAWDTGVTLRGDNYDGRLSGDYDGR